jgi:5-formyltetrahydrofolate cyclo-ligase
LQNQRLVDKRNLVALALSAQIVDKVPVEDTDIKPDFIITGRLNEYVHK